LEVCAEYGRGPVQLILDSEVGSKNLTQPIDSLGISVEILVTNKVAVISPDTPDKPMDYYAMHVLPTTVIGMAVTARVDFYYFCAGIKKVNGILCPFTLFSLMPL
jgi:hypothetical protein